MPTMCLMAVGMALVVAPLSAAVMGAVGDEDAGAASGINNAVSRIAGLLAVAAMGGIVTLVYAAADGPGSFGEAAGSPALAEAHRKASNSALSIVAWVTSVICAVAGIIGLFGLPRGPSPDGDAATAS